MMTSADFKEKIASGDHHYPPKIQAIIRAPGNEHLVSAGELETAQVAGKEPRRGKIPLCMMDCGHPAAQGDVYCHDCRSGLNCR
jgi:hypothetical protein